MSKFYNSHLPIFNLIHIWKTNEILRAKFSQLQLLLITRYQWKGASPQFHAKLQNESSSPLLRNPRWNDAPRLSRLPQRIFLSLTDRGRRKANGAAPPPPPPRERAQL